VHYFDAGKSAWQNSRCSGKVRSILQDNIHGSEAYHQEPETIHLIGSEEVE
jgi:hypothetical protein